MERNTRIRASQIINILPLDLDATNAYIDNYVPSYDLATGKFTWINQDELYPTRTEWNQNGFENRSDSVLAWTDSTPDRTLSIQPSVTGGSFDYWIAGIKYTSFGDTVQITDVEGVHYIYYDGDTLTVTANPSFLNRISIIETKALVSIVYWNATDKEGIYIGEERHGKSMSPYTHSYLHFTDGLKYVEGIGLNTLSVDQDGDDNEDAQFGIDSGSIADEDLFLSISSIVSTVGLPIYYMTGATPTWNKIINTGYSVIKTGATGEDRLAYNQYTGGSWQLTEVSNQDFVLCHIFATTEKDKPMIAIVGQNIYTNTPQARVGAESEIRELILNDIIFPEIRPIATVILQTDDTYNNTMKARVISTSDGDDYIDWRSEIISRVAISTSNHNSLTVLQGGAVSEYYHLTYADYTELNQWLDNVTLGSDGKLTLPLGVAINEFSLDGTLAGNSDLAVPTEKAVKTYVDGLDLDDISDGSIYKRLKVDDFTIKENSNIIKIADRIELNTMLLAFKMSVNEGESKFDMVDGMIDEYEDETGVDTETGGSTGQTYDGTNDLYKPTPGGTLEVDYCEYATDEDAQINWESSLVGGLNEDTKLLLRGNGVDGSKEILDDGNTGHIVTQNADATLSTAQKKFGSSACYFDGTGDYLSIPDSADWDVFASNSDDWTIDFWVKHTDHVGDECYISQSLDFPQWWQLLHIHGAGFKLLVYNSGIQIVMEGTGEITDSNWHHIALIKKADEYGIYLDGTQVNYVQDSSIFNISTSLWIGALNYSGVLQPFDGYMDEIRIIKSNIFSASPNSTPDDTITIPTAEHTSDSNTKLLLHMNTQDVSGDGGNGNYHIPTFYGTMQLDTAVKKFGSGSYLFDGDSDYISIPDSPDWDIIGSNSDDWTIDLWVKHTDHVGAECYISQSLDFPQFWTFTHNDGTGFSFRIYDSGEKISMPNGGEITDTNWHHIALIKVANEYGVYKDGVQVTYATTDYIFNISAPLWIGAMYYSAGIYQPFDGHMDEVRIQHSNAFSASPNVGKTDTISIPTAEYGESGLLSYSEDTIKQQGSYSLKIIANATISLNENVRNTFASSKDLSSYSFLKFDIRASRVGTNLQMRLHDETTGSIILTKDIEIATGEEDTWKTITWDISGETGTNLDQVDYIELKIINADAENTIYLDNIYVGNDPSNMILISEAFNAETDPNTARIILFEQDVDEITVNTHIKAYVSKDDGATWAQVTLTDEGDYNNNIRILSGIVDLTQTGIDSATGFPMRYKVTTHNEKNLYLHGTGVNYD